MLQLRGAGKGLLLDVLWPRIHLAAAIVIVKSGREVLAELKELILEIQAFVRQLNGIKKAVIKVGEETVDLLDMTEKTLDAKLQKKRKSWNSHLEREALCSIQPPSSSWSFASS